MRKIRCVFMRDEHGVTTAVPDPVNLWVLHGEGLATRKWDGTACMVRGGELFRRWHGKRLPHPPGFIAGDPATEGSTGPGWIPIGPGDKWHLQVREEARALPDGTYELIGPPIQANAENVPELQMRRHGADVVDVGSDRSWAGLRAFLVGVTYEGIVFHHPDGRMAKICRRHLGLPYPVRQ